MSDTKKVFPETEVNFMGEKVKVVFSLASFCKLEDLTGINALDGDVWKVYDVRTLSLLLWAGLLTHKPDITLEEVRENMSLQELLALYSEISIAFKNASPAKEEKKSEQAAA